MITRTLDDGRVALIYQTHHSQLAGQLAAHWGNAEYAAPEPYDSVMRAATFHDFGWLDYETRPLVNLTTGSPYQFRELPFRPEQLAAYDRWIDWITAIDPYAGLLVSMHRTGLWQSRYGTIVHPAGQARALPPQIQEFITRQEGAQLQLKAGYPPGPLGVNYHLLQVWDLLSLYLCEAPQRPDYLEPVPTSYAGNGHVRLELTPQSEWEIALAPYPFDMRPLQVQISHKRLPRAQFASEEEFRRAYFQAEPAVMSYTLL